MKMSLSIKDSTAYAYNNKKGEWLSTIALKALGYTKVPENEACYCQRCLLYNAGSPGNWRCSVKGDWWRPKNSKDA